MDQLDLFNSPKSENERILIRNGKYLLIKQFFNKSLSDNYFRILLESIEWKQEKMNMYGKELLFPRLTAWYGDNDKPYSFSGITLKSLEWTKELLDIKNQVESKTDVIFNSVLLNRYRNGSDSISWHTDAEKELGLNPIIASVNFGATREFQLRHKETKEKISIELTHGSLLIMEGELQHYWQHQVPKTKKPVNERINLTFRVIKK
ncbi:alpha-ketoglutarate-dependent dioxygenase AlkB family protein [Flavobacterium sp. N1719]|uniref:alpha-ketoglutarate-dependent dioxygenase AlkB family protein n=1 Tax=Flavobacterium sp. N1719 TaxID=2885633 RepID=UPI002221E14A|nr:alpha-ketoglutarate-dependent dioxygenase AlkB [Flavobacterium sp. N1719]